MNTNIGRFTKIHYVFLFVVGLDLFLFGKPFYGFLCFLILLLYVRKNQKIQLEKNIKVITEQEKKIREEKIIKAFQKTNKKKEIPIPKWKKSGYLSYEEYIAERERRLRKKEQNYMLAKAYRQRRKISDFKRNLITVDNLLKLTPVEFEKWVKANIFEKEGWTVAETKTTGDGGIDLILTKNGERSIAQCKRYRNTVGEPLLRDFYGTIMGEGVSRGFFITTGLFSLSALKFVEDKPISLIDRRILTQKLGGDKT